MDNIFGTLNIPNLSEEDLQAIADAQEWRKKQNKSRERYKTVYEEKHVYENGKLVVKQVPKVVKYTDTSIPDADGKCDSNMSLIDLVRQAVPELSEAKVDSKGRATTELEKCAPRIRLAEFKGKNSAMRRIAGAWVKSADFYKDLYSYPAEFSDSDKGQLVYTLKTKNENGDYRVICADVDEFGGVLLSDRNDVITYICDWFVMDNAAKDTVRVVPRKKFIKNIFAFCVDVDGVFTGNFCKFLENDWSLVNTVVGTYEKFPKPTYIVNSGTGLHLYYLLEVPVPYFRCNTRIISDLYVAMQRKYNTFKTKENNGMLRLFDLCGKFQSEYGETQAFRMVGTKTKLDTHVSVIKYGEKYSIDSLLSAFGMGDCAGLVVLRGEHDSDKRGKATYDDNKYVKHLEGKPLSKAMYRLECLKADIPRKTNNLYNDLAVYAKSAKSAGKSFNDVHGEIAGIVDKYMELHPDEELVPEVACSRAMVEFDCTAVGEFVNPDDCKLSYKVVRTGLMAPGLYTGILKKCKSHVWVGNRYKTIMALGYIAVRCNISKEQYLEDMEGVYENILAVSKLNGFVPFEESDYEAALLAAGIAFDEGRMAKTKTIESWLGWRYTTDSDKGVYIKQEKTSKSAYVKLTISAIVICMSMEINKGNFTTTTININGTDENVYMVKFPTIQDISKLAESFDLGLSESVKYSSSYGVIKKYYDDAVVKFKEFCLQHTGMENVVGNNGAFIGYNMDCLLSPYEKIKKYMLEDGVTSTKELMDLSGLSKPSVIKYKRMVEQETAN